MSKHLYATNARSVTKRKAVIKRLEDQLKRGTKPENDLHLLTLATAGSNQIPLTEHDRKRISKEIETLKSRI